FGPCIRILESLLLRSAEPRCAILVKGVWVWKRNASVDEVVIIEIVLDVGARSELMTQAEAVPKLVELGLIEEKPIELEFDACARPVHVALDERKRREVRVLVRQEHVRRAHSIFEVDRFGEIVSLVGSEGRYLIE